MDGTIRKLPRVPQSFSLTGKSHVFSANSQTLSIHFRKTSQQTSIFLETSAEKAFFCKKLSGFIPNIVWLHMPTHSIYMNIE